VPGAHAERGDGLDKRSKERGWKAVAVGSKKWEGPRIEPWYVSQDAYSWGGEVPPPSPGDKAS